MNPLFEKILGTIIVVSVLVGGILLADRDLNKEISNADYKYIYDNKNISSEVFKLIKVSLDDNIIDYREKSSIKNLILSSYRNSVIKKDDEINFKKELLKEIKSP